MRSQTMLLLLFVTLVIWQPLPPLTRADTVTTELTLYAHTDPSAMSVGGRVLSLSRNATSRHFADVRDGLAFTLVPSLSGPLHILGGIDVYVWLISQQTVRGTLRFALSEVSGNGSVAEIRSGSVTIAVATVPYLVDFGQGPVDYTVKAGSTLRLVVQFSAPTPVPVLLLWDDIAVATRLLLKVESVPKIDLSVKDISGRPSAVFPENPVGIAKLIASVSIEDPFHGTNVRMVSLNLTNSSGGFLVMNAPMNLTSHSEDPFRLEYELPIAVPSGVFNVTASVRDIADRTFLATREITVTRFHTLVLMLVDGQGRPLPNLNVSVVAAGALLEEVSSDSSGTAIVNVPPTQVVGPLTLQVRNGRQLIVLRSVESESDAVLQLQVPLYDWSIAVRYQGVNIPASGAGVCLYLNGTMVASAMTDLNGMARFVSVPLGSFQVTVNSTFGSKDFFNVTHSAAASETNLELPPLSGITATTMLALAAIALIAVFGVVAATRRKMKAPRFRHVAELIGGAIPQSSIILLVGPSGAGKSTLLQNILTDLLELDRHCVYVSNAELPSNIRKQLVRMGLKVKDYEKEKKLKFIDAYSGETGTLSGEEYSTPSPNDLTALGIQLTYCIDELGGKADVFLDSLTPILSSGSAERGLEFVRYYGARVTKSGGAFLCVATTAIESIVLSRLEEASDCVLQIERSTEVRNVVGRLLVKKARGVEHEREWVGFRITSKGRIEFVSLPSNTH